MPNGQLVNQDAFFWYHDCKVDVRYGALFI